VSGVRCQESGVRSQEKFVLATKSNRVALEANWGLGIPPDS